MKDLKIYISSQRQKKVHVYVNPHVAILHPFLICLFCGCVCEQYCVLRVAGRNHQVSPNTEVADGRSSQIMASCDPEIQSSGVCQDCGHPLLIYECHPFNPAQ